MGIKAAGNLKSSIIHTGGTTQYQRKGWQQSQLSSGSLLKLPVSLTNK